MTLHIVGDLQGCYQEFQDLLEVLAFDDSDDELWVAGDIVNRGPGSLECLRSVYQRRDRIKIILGNHDLHLLAVAHGHGRLKKNDTLAPILDAPDCAELIEWLRRQPLMRVDRAHDVAMVHAGLLSSWSVTKAEGLAREVEEVLGGDQVDAFLSQMYGNTPSRFTDTLTGMDRIRAIVNVMTRMRFIDEDGTLDFAAKEGLSSAPDGFKPWFQFPRTVDDLPIAFGHWAALEGRTPESAIRCWALDTGCVWRGTLTALTLPDATLTSVPSRQ
ncbi:symmetrical bis(5'-nucleosyl)-tetraphosphatase [Larsenimonas suaedae]|uniref:bis(5'-nucleosyl)-tetraphosphatase (symmetrical) n=1 Tax=Larsenimonas suaedae TaxID=1851019 RepID=A0ABU1GTM3_9GAMM|nr:symmetrical bis(5'-nucleosyl)-tetraphosphatase [Larsenimonas suaedae]MCM2971827.1 symmetrical bis(5'-nucleosyl)-tetraphosphatase [Larsenimonas suaedae]MDR5895379.1 symmetrical bis(5'-nucleosyl)-tetraphosphatase [Larsenimonas suaedae]